MNNDYNIEPLVSIICITYNHEKFIEEAIKGFLKQETDFSFEIIIQDDASTDRTAEIIREYEKKYPDRIKTIYNIENQYSKCPSSIDFPPLKASKGKYIAYCEGDDYWIDPLKLQKQIAEMNKHPECQISFHPAIEKWEDGSSKDKILNLHSKKNKIFTIEEVILGGGDFMPTASIVFNASVIPRLISFFEIAKETQTTDYYIQILGSEIGGALYLTDVMSVYRKCSNSWSDNFVNNSDYFNSVVFSMIETINEIDVFTNHKYTEQFENKKKNNISNILNSLIFDIMIREKVFKIYKNEVRIKDKILWYTIFKHQTIVNFLKTMKKLAIDVIP